MPRNFENSIRRQQLQLLRFEKFVRGVAPAAIALGLGTGTLAISQEELAKLDFVRLNFERSAIFENSAPPDLSAVIQDISSALVQLHLADSKSQRTEIMFHLMSVLDRGHSQAEIAALDKSIRLVGYKTTGRKVDGGTPKKPPNVEWLVRFLTH